MSKTVQSTHTAVIVGPTLHGTAITFAPKATTELTDEQFEFLGKHRPTMRLFEAGLLRVKEAPPPHPPPAAPPKAAPAVDEAPAASKSSKAK